MWPFIWFFILTSSTLVFSIPNKRVQSQRNDKIGNAFKVDPFPKWSSNGDPKIFSCNSQAEIEKGEVALIESPNFGTDRPYPISTDCKWNFWADCNMSISCPIFSLNDAHCADTLEIMVNSTKYSKFCGRNGPQNLTLNNNAAIKFHTDRILNLPGYGFQCQITCIDDEPHSDVHSDLRNLDSFDCDCGDVVANKKIVNGIETEVNQYLFMAALVKKGEIMPFCGGTLVNNLYVLTAAHCVKFYEAEEIQVVLLEHNILVDNETAKIILNVVDILEHPDYTYYNDYDAALLRLSEPVILGANHGGPNLLNICLPKEDYDEQWEGLTAVASGWGRSYTGGPTSPTLQHVNLTIMSNQECKKFYPASGVLWPRMMCASALNKDSCEGDSGGPMMAQLPKPPDQNSQHSQYSQIGIVSWGPLQGCASGGPGVYTRISEVATWISANIRDGRSCRNLVTR